MTTLVCWAGVDPHGPTSVYIGSDSRISWKPSRWNLARKLYASKNSADIFGFSGKVDLPCHALGQIVELIDAGLFFETSDSFDVRLEAVRKFVYNSYQSLPKRVSGKFTIVYASRIGVKMNSSFHIGIIKGNSAKQVVAEVLPLPEKSSLVHRSGSGSSEFRKQYETWVGQPLENKISTSRAVFGALCESIDSGKDPYTGGAPQLVGLYRSGGNGQSFGVIHKGQRYMYGALVENGCGINNIQWHNELFEICCGETMQVKDKAQRQPKVV
ncbi:TPA: hypothetical protein ACGUTZ_004370 [Vibrio vulnificus]